MVTTQGTWLGDLVEHYNCGSVVSANAPNKLASAVYDVVLGYADYAANSRFAAKDYFSKNSWHDLGCSIIEGYSNAGYGGGGGQQEDARRLKELERENKQLKRLVAERELENVALK